jgi:hypothetical protein
VLSASSGQQSVPPTSSAQLATSSAQAATSAPSTGPTSGTTTSGTTSGTTSTPRRRFPVWWQSALPVFFALLVYKDNVAARRWGGDGWAGWDPGCLGSHTPHSKHCYRNLAVRIVPRLSLTRPSRGKGTTSMSCGCSALLHGKQQHGNTCSTVFMSTCIHRLHAAHHHLPMRQVYLCPSLLQC